MLSFEKDPDSPRYLWLGGHDTVTPEDIKTLVECYKEKGYIIRCNHKADYGDPIQVKFLGNHIWYMTKDNDHWLMLAFHYGRSQWFVESFVVHGNPLKKDPPYTTQDGVVVPGRHDMLSMKNSYLVK